MARCKNVSGAPASSRAGTPGGDGGDDRPRCLTTSEKGKKVVSKKRKSTNRDTEAARVVAIAVEAAEAGGRRGTLRIGSELSSA